MAAPGHAWPSDSIADLPMLIAQISDLHVRPEGVLYKGVVDSNRMLADAIAHVNVLRPRPEVLLISGDLVDEGQPAEYANLRKLLAPCEVPYFVMAGNHDERQALRAAFADHAYLPPGSGALHYVIEDYPVRIVAFDTTVPGKHVGAVDDAGLAWLADTLARDRARPAILLLHHPPFACGIPYLDQYRCFDAGRLAKVVAQFDHVERVVCGHVHRLMLLRWGGTIAAACPSTATQIALRLDASAEPASYREPPACLLHLWRPGLGMMTHTSYIGRFDGPYPFA
jgi:3',5'-cyclic-AMP phosphodiesterase